jgi:ribosomal protein S5
MTPSIEGWVQAAVRIVLEVAGVKMLEAIRSNNLNNARASICALNNLTTKSQSKKRDFRNVDNIIKIE